MPGLTHGDRSDTAMGETTPNDLLSADQLLRKMELGLLGLAKPDYSEAMMAGGGPGNRQFRAGFTSNSPLSLMCNHLLQLTICQKFSP
jgi:hypothetical protein